MEVLASPPMNPASNLILVGPTGAGKTSIGRRIAERFGLRFVDVDQLITERSGASIPTLFEHVGETGFRERETATLRNVLADGGQLVSTGGGAVLDAGNRQLIGRSGYVVYLQVDVEAQLKRLGRCTNRPLLQQTDRAQTLHDMASLRQPLYAEIADLTLDTSRLTPAEATIQLTRQLLLHWQRTERPA